MTRILAIAYNTYREAIRDRILYGFLFFAILIILFSLVLGQLSLDQHVRITIDVGMAGISLFSVLISIFIGITLLNKEIQKRTIYPVLAKPISRIHYLAGKFIGISWVLMVQMGLMLCVFFALILFQDGHITAGLLTAIGLIFLETLMVIAMALFFTSFSSPFLSGIFCIGLFVAGRNAQLISDLGNQRQMESMAPLLDAISTILPGFYLFYPSGKIVEGTFATVHAQFVTTGYLFSAAAYALFCTAAFLCAAMLILRRRDFL